MLSHCLASYRRWLLSCALLLVPAISSRSEEPVRSSPQKLAVQIKVIEFEVGKLKSLGFDWAKLGPGGIEQQSAEEWLRSIGKKQVTADQFTGFINALEENRLARTLAEPSIVTLDGRPASFASGGTQLDIVPIVLASGRVKLECRIEIAAPQIIQPGRTSPPETRLHPPLIRLDAATDLEPGKSAIIGHARTVQLSEGKSIEKQLLVLAQVVLLESSRTAKIETPLPLTDRELTR